MADTSALAKGAPTSILTGFNANIICVYVRQLIKTAGVWMHWAAGAGNDRVNKALTHYDEGKQ